MIISIRFSLAAWIFGIVSPAQLFLMWSPLWIIFTSLLYQQLGSSSLFMVLLSFKFHTNLFFIFFIVNKSVLFTSYFNIFLLVVVFAFSHS